MSDDPELNGNETLESLCAAAGAAVGGPFGQSTQEQLQQGH